MKIHARKAKSQISYCGALLLAFFAFTAKLWAQPPVRILSLDESSYPHISLTLRLRQPHPEFVQKEPTKAFAVSEIHENSEKDIKEFRMELVKKEAQNVNIVWLVDASLSLQPQNFQKVITFSQKLIENFRNGETMAIYSVKAKPDLLLDFSGEKQKLLNSLKAIQHDGKITHLYDALYAGIYTAQSLRESNAKKIKDSRTVVVLLTDGKEETSYLNANDCYELSSISKGFNIPVYVLLWDGNGDAESKEKSKSKALHYRLLKRLSLKTKGALLSNPKPEESRLLLRKLYQLSQPLYRISYLSPKEGHGLAGSQVIVRVALQEGGYSDIRSFRVPWSSLFLGSMKPFFWLLCLLLFSFLLFVIFFFAFPYRSYKIRKKESLSEKGSYALLEKQLEKEKAESTTQARNPYTPTEVLEESYAPRHDTQDSQKVQDIRKLQNAQDPLAPLEVPQDSSHVLIENERSLYLREQSYRILQLALRDATPYRRAALRTVIPSQPPRKRVYDLFLGSTLLGSGRWAHIPVRDPLASPIHARIKKVDRRFVIYDMLSGSGLYVNSKKLLRPKGLQHGDEIRIGRMLYTFLGK